MTSYFDDATRAVREIPATVKGPAFVAAVRAIEEPVVRDVSLCSGDREFPADLRERVMVAIATKSMYSPAGLSPDPDAVGYVLTCRASELLEVLHSAFHALASRRIVARFGLWDDSPRSNLTRRDNWEKNAVVEP